MFTKHDGSTWRLVNANEKELLLGYGYRHTALAWSASKIKQDPVGYSDVRNSFLGDSFSIYSFCILAATCAKRFIPTVPYKLLVQRMGLAPGFRASVRCFAPLQHKLLYGSSKISPEALSQGCAGLNRLLLRRTNHTGSDIRVVSGEIMNSKTYPRQSICSQWWQWKEVFSKRWKRQNHINILELESVSFGNQISDPTT